MIWSITRFLYYQYFNKLGKASIDTLFQTHLVMTSLKLHDSALLNDMEYCVHPSTHALKVTRKVAVTSLKQIKFCNDIQIHNKMEKGSHDFTLFLKNWLWGKGEKTSCHARLDFFCWGQAKAACLGLVVQKRKIWLIWPRPTPIPGILLNKIALLKIFLTIQLNFETLIFKFWKSDFNLKWKQIWKT